MRLHARPMATSHAERLEWLRQRRERAKAWAERWSNVLTAAAWAVLIATMYAGLLTVH